jgi:hypothetical protein
VKVMVLVEMISATSWRWAMERTVKAVYWSKINWLGVVLTLCGALSDPKMQELIPQLWASRIMYVSGVLLVILRTFFCNTALQIRPTRWNDMKMLTVALITCAMLQVGCVTVGTTSAVIPVGCEKSVLYQHHKEFNTVASLMVIGVHAYAIANPYMYQEAKTTAKVAIAKLEVGSVTAGELTSDTAVALLLSDLLAFFAPGEVIDQCDKDLLIAQLKRI